MASSTISLLGPNSSHFIKLTDSNYLLWLRQLKPFLVGHDLWKFIDGTHKQPSAHTSTSTTETSITTTLPQPNPAHSQWYQQDQLIVSYITSTLSESILSLTVGCTSTRDLWECLQRHFSQSSMASESALRFQLMDLQKGSQPIDAYLRHAKSLADSLAAINEPVSPKELVTAVLRGL